VEKTSMSTPHAKAEKYYFAWTTPAPRHKKQLEIIS
jgi:hypothetical protein